MLPNETAPTQAQETVLLDCPFCGAVNENGRFLHDPGCFLMTLMRIGVTPQAMAEAWNRRPLEDKLRDELLALINPIVEAFPAHLTYGDYHQALAVVLAELSAYRKAAGKPDPGQFQIGASQ